MKNKDLPAMPYLLQKQGMYYAHNNRGYVSRALLAEIYTKEYAELYASKHDDVHAIPVSDVLSSEDDFDGYIERIEAMRDALNADMMLEGEQ